MDTLLQRIEGPADIAPLGVGELEQLASEVRAFMIDAVSRTGGHLAANLGVVELTIALLKTFQPPRDKIVWDTSHQCYAFKMLTGRRDRMHTLRQFGGLAGFLRRDESPCDAFGAGHAGTALSAALGMAAARDRRGGPEHIVAVVGDAAAGCGISMEAFNNLAGATRRIVVILNDNEMSISRNVGAMSRYLGGLLANPRYNRWKRSVETVATRMRMGSLRSVYYRMEEAIKSLFLGSVMFEEFGLRYVGPIDGHDFPKLLDALEVARESDRPILLHVSTRKGKGYPYAEKEPTKWHGTSCFDVASGDLTPPPPMGPTYSAVFGETLCRLAAKDDRICAITAGMCTGTGMDQFAARFPDRFFDVGISEEHGAVFAAGLAAEGMRPVYVLYSTFAQRVVDCVIHDICLQKLPVVLCLDRAGIVGDDGPTHHGILDIALFRALPNLVMMQPADEAELADMLYGALKLDGPALIRYPRGRGPGVAAPAEPRDMPIGVAQVVREGGDVLIWALGDMLATAVQVADILRGGGLAAGVVNARFIRPLDARLLAEQARGARAIVTIENGVVEGGFGSLVGDFLHLTGFGGRMLAFGWPTPFVPHGGTDRLLDEFGLRPGPIAERIRKVLNAET